MLVRVRVWVNALDLIKSSLSANVYLCGILPISLGIICMETMIG